MNQSQINTVRSTINARAEVIAASTYPCPEAPDASKEIALALVSGKKIKMRSQEEIRQIALKKIVGGRYASDRSLELSELYEPSALIAAAQAKVAAANVKRSQANVVLSGIAARVMGACKMGQYDADPSAAIAAFEEAAAAAVAKLK